MLSKTREKWEILLWSRKLQSSRRLWTSQMPFNNISVIHKLAEIALEVGMSYRSLQSSPSTKIARNALEQPPYRLDVPPCDFHLFGPMKEAIGATHFDHDKDMELIVQNWLSIRPLLSMITQLKHFLFFKKKCVLRRLCRMM